MGESLVKILNKAGIEVVFPEGQTCCGAPARYSGAYEVAAQNANDNIKALLAGRCNLCRLGMPDLHRSVEA
jgi:L-lactate dehydrogenase complex protein LldF